MTPVNIDGRNIVPPTDWDFLSDDGRIVTTKRNDAGFDRCGMFVDGVLTEFYWKENTSLVIVSENAGHIAEKLNAEIAESGYVAVAYSETTINFFENEDK